MHRLFGTLLLLPIVAACGGGVAPASAPLEAVVSNAIVPMQGGQRLTEAQSDAAERSTSASAVGVSSGTDLLYVSNTGSNTITVYPHAAVGNTAPLYVIAGPKTGLNNAGQLSQDAAGNLYVANGNELLVFAHGANGNVAPSRVLSGSLTGIHAITAMTVDQKTGKIFIGDTTPGADPSTGALLRFPPNASGNTAPFARSLAAGYTSSFASDSTGVNLITADSLGVSNFDRTITTYVKQFANASYPQRAFGINAVVAAGIADDPTTKTYLATMNGQIVRFAENTVGNGAFLNAPAKFTPAIVSTITSDQCGSQLAVAPGPSPNTYVSHSTAQGCPTDAVYVYTNAAAGNAAPLRVLSGPATKLDRPAGIYEGR